MSSCGSCANVVPRTVGDPYQLSEEGSEVEMDQKADEIKRLQGCINDLISVLALPARSAGRSWNRSSWLPAGQFPDGERKAPLARSSEPGGDGVTRGPTLERAAAVSRGARATGRRTDQTTDSRQRRVEKGNYRTQAGGGTK